MWLIEHRKYHNLLLPSTTLKMLPMNVTFLSKANLIKICTCQWMMHTFIKSVYDCHLLVTLTYYCRTLGQAHHPWKLFINKVSQCNYTGLQENSSNKLTCKLVKVWATDSKSVLVFLQHIWFLR